MDKDEQFRRDLYEAISTVFRSYSIPVSHDTFILDRGERMRADTFEINFAIEQRQVYLEGYEWEDEPHTIEILPSIVMSPLQQKVFETLEKVYQSDAGYYWGS